MDQLSGVITRVNYYNQENGYTIAILELDYKDKNIAMKKAKILGNTIPIVGFFDRVPSEFEEYIIEGEYIRNPNYGLQFKFSKYTRKTIENEQGIVSYLSSPLFPGIGVKIAKTILENLGTECISKIKEDPSVLDNISLTEKQKSVIISGIISDSISQEAVIFFLDNGITLDTTHKIIALFGDMAKEIVLENPYILMEKINRFGFKKNDAFALKIGVEENSITRLKALLTYVLQEALYSIGNSYISKGELYEATIRYIGKDVDGEVFNQVIDILTEAKKIYIDKDQNIYDYNMYIQELELALTISNRLNKIGEEKPIEYSAESIEKCFEQVKNASKMEYSTEQLEAIRSAFVEPIVIITGGPGTGKTTIIKAIIDMFMRLNHDNSLLTDYIALLAPTGKAAKRMKESTSMHAMTIHKYLGYTGDNIFTYSKYNKTTSKLIIVDEASMMDLPLASRLFTSSQDDARIIIVGDVDQLPSVGPGQVLKDLIDSKEIKTIKLTKIHRQAEDSSIIKLAHNVNEGILPDNLLDKLNDRTFISTDNEYLASILVNVVKRFVDKGYDVKKDIQVLIPMYKGDCGINEINNKIQELINPLEQDETEIKHYGRTFRENDKVIQLVNRAEKNIMNGDVGYVRNFNYKNLKPIGLTVVFDSVVVDYTIEELEDLSLAYAISVHKAQGGEFDVVLMPFTTKHYIMLKRKLIYTGITRAKKSLIMLGDPHAMSQGIRRIEANRKTILKETLIDYIANKVTELKISKPLKVFEKEESSDSLGEEFKTISISDFEDLL